MNVIFANKGIPEVCQSDNGPPFQSHEMSMFARENGYYHKHVTPEWPRANGTVERFNRSMKEAIQTAHVEGVNIRRAAQDYVEVYRATPHSATGTSPYAAMYGGRQMRTRLPMLPTEGNTIDREKDNVYRQKMAESRKGSPHQLKVGDQVLIRQAKKNKLTPRYNPEKQTVVEVWGSSVDVSDGQKTVMRDGSQFKKVLTDEDDEEEEKMTAGLTDEGAQGEATEQLHDARPVEVAVQTDARLPTMTDAQAGLESDQDASPMEDLAALPESVRRCSIRKRQMPVRLDDYVLH